MKKIRPRVPIGLPVAGALLLVAGLLLQPVFRNLPREVVVRNTILAGIPFIMIFVSIIIFFISAIWLISSVLSHNIPRSIYDPVEKVIIAGVVLGVVGMFQPWLHILYRLGFHLLLVSTIAFMVWSHITPAGKRAKPHLTTGPADEAGG